MPTFERTIELPVSAAQLFAWHDRPGAFERLVPPWDDIEVVHKKGSIRDGDILVMKVHKGPASVTWEAHHESFIENQQFVDRQVRGPFASWVHTHRFEVLSDSSSRLVDHVEYELPGAPLTNIGRGTAEATFDKMFRFRHRRTLQDLTRHARVKGEPLKVAISGASGFIGTALSAFLTTGGHEVVPLVRKKSDDGIYWNIAQDEIDADALEGLDAVIHLAGESISGRWSDQKKRRILESRVKGTTLLARTLAKLDRPPQVFISASAIGFYGNRGDQKLDEDSPVGDGFLAEVCAAWEASADAARNAGIRVIHPRIGVVLSPKGGALEQMLTPFKLGAGGVVGDGTQYMSWITLDDLVGAFLHLLTCEDLEGPVNMTAPTPVTNREFTRVLGQVLHRPTFLPLPKFGVKLALGQMGESLLLDSARVLPKQLSETGFEFLHTDLETGIRAELGK